MKQLQSFVTLLGCLALTAIQPIWAQHTTPPKPSETDQKAALAELEHDLAALSIERAVSIALEASPTIWSAQLDIEHKEWGKKAAIGKLFPTAAIQATYGYTLKKQVMYLDGFPGASQMPREMLEKGIEVGRSHNIQTGINAQLSLINASLWHALSLSREQVELSLAKAATSRVNKVAEVRKAYLTAQLAEESLHVLRKSYDMAVAIQRDIEKKFSAGLVARYDLLRSQVQVKNLEPNLLQATNNSQLAKKQLLALMGLPLEMEVHLTTKLSNLPAPTSLDAAVAHSSLLVNNRTLIELGHQQRLLAGAVTAVKLSFWPTLSMSGMYQYNFSSNDFKLGNKRNWTPFSMINFSLSIPISTGGQRYFSLRQNQIQHMLLDLQRRDLDRQLTVALDRTQAAMRAARGSIDAAREAVAAAEEGYSIAKKRYDVGEGTLLEINDAQVQLLQAQLAEQQAIYQLQTALVERDQLMGTLPEDAQPQSSNPTTPRFLF